MAALAGIQQRFHGLIRKPEVFGASPERDLQRQLDSLMDCEPESMMTAERSLQQRLTNVLERPENMVCCDCSALRPRWASLIVPPSGSARNTLPIGALCCLECSGSHRRLGVHVCYVRSVILDSLKEEEISALENGGNAKVNAIYEARINESTYARPDPTSSNDVRQQFIQEKYDNRSFYDANKMNQYAVSSGDHFILETIQTSSSVEVTIIRETA